MSLDVNIGPSATPEPELSHACRQILPQGAVPPLYRKCGKLEMVATPGHDVYGFMTVPVA